MLEMLFFLPNNIQRRQHVSSTTRRRTYVRVWQLEWSEATLERCRQPRGKDDVPCLLRVQSWHCPSRAALSSGLAKHPESRGRYFRVRARGQILLVRQVAGRLEPLKRLGLPAAGPPAQGSTVKRQIVPRQEARASLRAMRPPLDDNSLACPLCDADPHGFTGRLTTSRPPPSR